MQRSGKRPYSGIACCSPCAALIKPERLQVEFVSEIEKIAADDRLYFMHKGILHSTPSPPSEPHPVHAGAHRRAAGWFVWGKGGREVGRAAGMSTARPSGRVVSCIAFVSCSGDAMRCDASPLPRLMLARKNSRADGLPAHVGSRAEHGNAQLLASAPGNFLQVTPRSRPAVHRRRVYIECISALTSVQSSTKAE